jgi:ligand-binding sensor domain-containing protein
MKKKLSIIFILLFLFTQNLSIAQRWTYYKDNTDFRSSALSKDGTIWSCTTDEITHITAKDSIIKKYPKIDGSAFLSVFIDKTDNLWTTTAYGVYKFDGKVWNNMYIIQAISRSGFKSVIQDKNDNLWFAGYEKIVKFDGKIWTEFNSKDVGSDFINSINCIFQDKNNNIWFGSNFGLLQYNGKDWKEITTANSGLLTNFILQITDDITGNIWFGTLTGISKFDGKNWTNYVTADIKDGLFNDSISAVFRDKDGTIWAGSLGSYIYKFDGNKWVTVDLSTTKIKLNKRRINTIFQDNEGNIWFNGTSKFDGNSWKDLNFGADEFPAHNFMSSSVGPNESFWFGTEAQGIFIFDGNKWLLPLNISRGTPFNQARYIMKDSKDNMWVVGVGGFNGLIKISPSNSRTFFNSNDNSNIVNSHATSIIEDKKGKIWICSSTGVSIFENEKWTFFNNKSLGLTKSYVNQLVEYKGNVVLGTSDGSLLNFDGIKTNTFDIGISKDTIRYVSKFFVDKDENLWVNGFNKIWIFDGKSSKKINIPSEINSINQDVKGTIWISCLLGGIYTYYSSIFTEFLSNIGGDYTIRGILIDSKEKIWFGSSSGISIFCPYLSPMFEYLQPSVSSYEKQNKKFQVSAWNIETYQWQVLTTKNPTWQNISSSDNDYEGQLTNSMTLKSAQIAQNGSKYRCLLVNGCNNVYSNATTLSVSAILGLQNEEEKEDIIYPNPASDFVKINNTPQKHFIVSIADSNGNILRRVENENQISTKELSSGTYYLKVETLNNVINHKFVILR